MSKTKIHSSFRNHSEKWAYFRARMMAQLLVIFISLTQAAHRLAAVFGTSLGNSGTAKLVIITLPFEFAFSLIVIFKYILYRKMHIHVLKYSDFIDIVFSLLFTAEWMLSLTAHFNVIKNAEGHCYSVFSLVNFCGVAWRTLLQILICQYWQVRIIGPIAVWIYLIQFAVKYDPTNTALISVVGTCQIVYIILIFYFEHRINFIMTVGNVGQGQWLQLNEFVLNNIPENIAIMDLNGNRKFISQNLQKTITRHGQQQNEPELFFRQIKDIQCLPQEEGDSHSDTFTKKDVNPTENMNPTQRERIFDTQDLDSFEDLISAFGRWILDKSVKEKSLYAFSGKFRQDEGSAEERSFQIHISFINQQPHKYILLILRDTTQRDLVLTLQGDMKYKDQLLASVSHELRTPLNGNINLLEAAIRSKDISDKFKESLLVPAVKSSKFLLYLVNDILDLYQMKAQKLRLVFQRSSLKDTLNNTLQLLELQAKKKDIRLEVDIDLSVPEMFCTDHARLSQIILNLMNNSIKFTQSGFVKLSAWSLRDSDDIKISVEDSGVGMCEEDIGKLFKDFTHIELKDREKLNPTGVGLGLKIANDLAHLLGSTGNKGIVVDSILNKGSTFSFVIANKETGLESQRNAEPKEEQKEEDSLTIPNEFNTATEASLEIKITHINSMWSFPRLTMETHSIPALPTCCLCPQILVVDDDSFNIMAYEVILDSLGVRYECAYNGRSAIDKMLNKVRYPCSLNCHPYKIVFMDEEMPGMNGRETVTEIVRLQKQGLLPQMDIVGCTAHHDKEHIEEFLRSGIVEYMPKPISFDTIKRVLQKYDR